MLEPGHVAAGDAISLIERPAAQWTLTRALHVLYRDTMNFDELAGLADLAPLAESWRALARRRIEHRRVEDWSRRHGLHDDKHR